MAHFAKVNGMGVVEQVIVAEQDFINALPDASSWIQTSYNTYGGQHPEGRPLRKNFAGTGYTYNKEKDAFIPPKLFASWVLNEDTCRWEAPIAMPQDGKNYFWNEATKNWVRF